MQTPRSCLALFQGRALHDLHRDRLLVKEL
jgi:hypothetical protein